MFLTTTDHAVLQARRALSDGTECLIKCDHAAWQLEFVLIHQDAAAVKRSRQAIAWAVTTPNLHLTTSVFQLGQAPLSIQPLTGRPLARVTYQWTGGETV